MMIVSNDLVMPRYVQGLLSSNCLIEAFEATYFRYKYAEGYVMFSNVAENFNHITFSCYDENST